MLHNNFMLYYNAPDTAGSGEPISRDGIRDALDKVDTPVTEDLEIDEETTESEVETEITEEVEETEVKDDKKSEEKDELAELEEELKEPDEKDLELTAPVKKREILAKYPNLFKDFPALQNAYYRELEYTRLLPTIKDAKEAVNAVNILNRFEQDLQTGNTQNVFKAMLEDDPNAFAKLADNYLENLAAVSEKHYHHVLTNITKDIVTAAVSHAKKTKNTDLQDAATLIYQFMTGETEWKPKQKLSIPEDSNESKEREAIRKEREEFENSRITGFKNDVTSNSNNRIKSIVAANIDKRNTMSEYVRDKATEDVIKKTESLIKADTRFQAVVNKLWEKARTEKYSKDSLNAIESAIVSKAKSLLPTVITSVKKNALKSTSTSRPRKINNTDEDTTDLNTERESAPRNRADLGDKNKPLPGESSLDFINRTSRA